MTAKTHYCLPNKRPLTIPAGYRCDACNWSEESSSSTPDPGMANFLTVNPEPNPWNWNSIHSATTSSPHESLYSTFPDFVDDASQTWMPENNFDMDQSSYSVTRSHSQRERLSVPNEHQLSVAQARLSTSYPGSSQFFGREQDDSPLLPPPPSAYSAEHLNVPRPEFEPVEPELPSTRQSQSVQTNPQNRVQCNLCNNTFSRQADVDRHVDTVHNRDQRSFQGNLLDCPWAGCHRKGNRAFARKDHWLEHRRNYHNEYIPKRRSRSRSSRHSGGSDDLPRAGS